jgi:Ca2+-transporting ATPase
MGRQGTDVARAVADVVLQDDNLHTMIAAVEQGRAIYANIRKSLRFLLSTNLSEIEVMLVTTALGLGEALNPMQLLWINLLTDIFPALALALEPPEQDVLRQKPRNPDEPIIRREDFLKLLKESSVISAGCLGVYLASMASGGLGLRASSNAFMTLTTSQLLHAVACRSTETTVLDRDRSKNPYLALALGGSLGLQLLALLVPPLRQILRVSPLSLADAALIAAGAGLPFVINESTKNLRLPQAKGH